MYDDGRTNATRNITIYNNRRYYIEPVRVLVGGGGHCAPRSFNVNKNDVYATIMI